MVTFWYHFVVFVKIMSRDSYRFDFRINECWESEYYFLVRTILALVTIWSRVKFVFIIEDLYTMSVGSRHVIVARNLPLILAIPYWSIHEHTQKSFGSLERAVALTRH